QFERADDLENVDLLEVQLTRYPVADIERSASVENHVRSRRGVLELDVLGFCPGAVEVALMPEQMVKRIAGRFGGNRVEATGVVDPQESSAAKEDAALTGRQRLHLARDGGPIGRGPEVAALASGRELPDGCPEVVVEQALIDIQRVAGLAHVVGH